MNDNHWRQTMSDRPIDPANQTIQQSERETHSFEGQQGHGVQYEDGQFQEGVTETPSRGRSGSYESQNKGGYGTGQPDATGERHVDERPVSPPDPEADQGQGGQ
jgi:hypothetical protein